jgi:hypothetical protein
MILDDVWNDGRYVVMLCSACLHAMVVPVEVPAEFAGGLSFARRFTRTEVARCEADAEVFRRYREHVERLAVSRGLYG